MVRLSVYPVLLTTLCIYGCGEMFGDSYDADRENDWKIVREIIASNPVLDSAMDSGHYFLPTDAEYGRITGSLNLSGLGLNDSNFHFPRNIQNFKLVHSVLLSFNDFAELPAGTRQKKWKRVVVSANKICNPSQETIDYLDESLNGYIGGYWRDSQRCSDSLSEASQ